MSNIHNTAKLVHNRESFVAFASKLSADWKNDSESWENRDLGAYLEAVAAWVEDMDGYYLNQGLPVPEHVNWKVLADILMAARVYE
jgi:hypothetical protein